MSWDAFQRTALAELGHVLYRLPGVAAPAAEPLPMDVDAKMLARLAKAAGVSPEVLQVQPGIAAGVSSLRGDSAAKRALWPQLRALRRGRS